MKEYFQNILVGLDQFVGTLFGIPADITISGWVGYKYPMTWMEKAINWAFQDPYHCQKYIEWDVINRLKAQGKI